MDSNIYIEFLHRYNNDLEEEFYTDIHAVGDEDISEISYTPSPLELIGIKIISTGIPVNFQSYFQKYRCLKTSKVCSICTESFKLDQLIQQTPCNHLFHDECVTKYIIIYSVIIINY
jgi:hypothetical protein